MFALWADLKIGFKLVVAFCAVIVLFAGAIIAIEIVNAKMAAIASYQSTKAYPARQAIFRAMSAFRGSDEDGAYYVMQRNPDQSSAYLRLYRADVDDLAKAVSAARSLAEDETALSALAAYQKIVDGPKGYFAGNEAAFGLKQSGKISDAIDNYSADSPTAAVIAAFSRYVNDLDGRIAAGNAQIAGLRELGNVLALVVSIVAIAFGLGIAFLIARNLAGSIGAITSSLDGIVKDDIGALSVRSGALPAATSPPVSPRAARRFPFAAKTRLEPWCRPIIAWPRRCRKWAISSRRRRANSTVSSPASRSPANPWPLLRTRRRPRRRLRRRPSSRSRGPLN